MINNVDVVFHPSFEFYLRSDLKYTEAFKLLKDRANILRLQDFYDIPSDDVTLSDKNGEPLVSKFQFIPSRKSFEDRSNNTGLGILSLSTFNDDRISVKAAPYTLVMDEEDDEDESINDVDSATDTDYDSENALESLDNRAIYQSKKKKQIFKLIQSPIVLEPYFNSKSRSQDLISPDYLRELITFEGARSDVTSYVFEKMILAYKIQRRLPRIIIWTRNERLSICGTYVIRADTLFELIDAIKRAVVWINSTTFPRATRFCRVAVYDLDRTLIDDNNKILHGVVPLLEYTRKVFDIIVIWSHGTTLHVHDNVTRIQNLLSFKFDLVLAQDEHKDTRSPKNLLFLYNYFPNILISEAVLIDDSFYNYTPEYSEFLVPATPKTLDMKVFIPILENFNSSWKTS